MKNVKNQPKKEKRLDWYDLPKGFTSITADQLRSNQFFFYHMTGQRRVVDTVSPYGGLIKIESTISSGKRQTHCVLPSKHLIVYT